ncbi:MAG: hypothetical protein WC917_03345 [Bacilli bacterium]|jgi:hypothetical protein
MEDYDVFSEMNNIKTIIMGIDIDDEKFWREEIISNSKIEFMPIRFTLNLKDFSNDYIDKTKSLFIYYFDERNAYNNELLKIKKHFIHYQRRPKFAYIPNEEKYYNLKKMIQEIGIDIVDCKNSLLENIKKI